MSENRFYTIVDLSHDGKGVIKDGDEVGFVSNTIPDETVLVSWYKKNKKIKFGKLINIEKNSEKRVEPICQHFFSCGGCQLQHLKYSEQLKFKQKKVFEVFKRVGKIDLIQYPEIVGFDDLNYRNKSTFFAQNGIAGFYKEESHSIIDLKSCPIQPEINIEISNFIKKYRYSGSFVIRNHNNKIMVIFENSFKNIDDLIKKFSNIISIYQKNRLIYGERYISEKIKNFNFLISPTSFFQINTKQTENLYQIAKDFLNPLKNETIVDCYCGTGSIGITISPFVKKIIGIELNKDSILDAIENSKINSIDNTEWIVGDATDIIQKEITIEKKTFDAIILDPPRAGTTKEFINIISNSKIKKVLYISCDPATLARDCALFIENGYILKNIKLVDMFPHTYHIESVVLLELG
ncbi:23S rRNA (uracil(1939)-C(5))-methyltransferase RlmD [bacterium]|nr:23S rRNA (uracil(1939)-C(5))-methyltransferase RlmD [bacterium]